MTRLEGCLTASAGFWRRGAESGLALLTVAALAGCPSSTDAPADLARPSDLATDGGVVKVQKAGCSKDDWCWMFPQPQGNTLWSVWGSSASDAWAVGDGGSLLHYTGGSWQQTLSPTSNPLFAVWGAAPNDVYAVGDRATVLHYDGQTWSTVNITGDTTGVGSLYGLWGSGKDNIWAVGAGGVVLHKTSSGLSRVPASQTKTTTLLKGVWGSGNSVYAVGAAGTVLTFDGTNWTTSTIPGAGSDFLTTVAGLDQPQLQIFVAAASGAIWRYSSGAWTQVSLFGKYGLYSLWASGSDVYAVGDVLYTDPAQKDSTKRAGTVKRWNGTGFTDVSGALPVALYGVWGSSASNLFLVGASGTVIGYDGSTFKSSSPIDSLTGVSAPLAGIAGSSSTNLVAVGDWGATLKWDGFQWSSLANSIYIRFRSISGTIDNLWSVAVDSTPGAGKSLLYQFSGGAWTPAVNPVSQNLNSIWVSGANGVAAGVDDTVIRRSGSSWAAVTVPAPTLPQQPGASLRGVWGADASHVWIVGGGDTTDVDPPPVTLQGKVIFFNGTTASNVPNLLPAPTAIPILWGVWGSDISHVWVVGDSGTILFFDGSKWTVQTSGTPFKLRSVWGTGPSDVYAVGYGGTVLHYNGQVWSRQETATSISFVDVWGVGKDIYATGYSGAVLHKTLP